MFGRKKKQAQAAAAPPADTADVPGEAMPEPDTREIPEQPMVTEAPVEASAPPAEAPEAEPPAQSAPAGSFQGAGGNGADGNGADGNGARGNGGRHRPREAARVTMDDFIGNPRSNEEQRQQAAAAELMAAIGPSQQMLMEEVPDASSPDDAAHRLLDRQNERPVLHDPEGEKLRGADIYRTDASVYYRLQKRFTWKPQPGPYKTRWAQTTLSEPNNDTTRRRLPKGR